MSGNTSNSKEVSVASDINYGEDVDGQALRPSSEQMVHAKVEANHPERVRDPEYAGMTLAQEEEARAREAEIARTRWARSADDREERTRAVVTSELTGIPEETRGVDWTADLDEDVQSLIREQAERIENEVDRGWTVNAIMQHLAKEITLGKSASAAVLDVLEAAKTAAGVFVEPHLVPKVDREECHVKGEVVTLWEANHPKIAQVGLLADDTDTLKFTSWEASGQIEVREGDHVVMRNVKRNWYQGRVSVALTSDSRIEFREKVPRETPMDQGSEPTRSGRSPGEVGGAGLKHSDLQDGLFNPESPDFEAPPSSGAEFDGTEHWEFPEETHETGRLVDYPHWWKVLE